MKKRVVVTGLGVVAPNGNDVTSFWDNIKNGVSGIDFITKFDTEQYKTKLAAEVKNFDAEKYIEKKEAKRMDKFSQFAIAAAKQAVENANFNLEEINNERFGVIVGSGIGGIETLEAEHIKLLEKGPKRVSPLFVPMMISNMAAGNVAIALGAKGVCYSVTTACATATHAIGEAFHNIQDGRSDLIVAGGTEAAITPLTVAGFESLTALSFSNNPKRGSIPFDAERDGFIIGEGSGVLVLEEYEHAKKRGAKIYAEVVGYGASCDAYHITSPGPGGEGGARAMSLAISDAGISKEEVSYINAHGTSTPANDKLETAAIKTVFGDYVTKVPVSSTKSMTGHLLGAAGGIELVICAKSIEEGFIPPTIGYEKQDPECDLDYVPNVGRKQEVKYAMSNSLGFGGHNATVILKKFED